MPFNPPNTFNDNPFSKQRSSDAPSFSTTSYSSGSDILKDLDRVLQKSKETRPNYNIPSSTQQLPAYNSAPLKQSAGPDIEHLLKRSQDLRHLVELSQKNPISVQGTANQEKPKASDMMIDINREPSSYQDYQKKLENYFSPTEYRKPENIPVPVQPANNQEAGKVKKVITKYHLNLQPIEEV